MGDDKYNFFVAVDAVVFTVLSGELHVLLIKNKFPPFQDNFALPGGRVYNNEELEDAVARELEEETNVKNIYLTKYNAYGKIGRDPRNRVISVAFLALIDHEKFKLHAKTDAVSTEWVPVSDVGKLSYDHNVILDDAITELRFDIQTTNIASELLPDKFTLTELQSTYESILDKELDKRNFRKRIKKLDILAETSESKMEGAHRPAKLYKFKSKKFKTIKDKIHVFV